MPLETGFFGNPDSKRHTMVHVWDPGEEKCLCGYVPARGFLFQWCAHGILEKFIECGVCLQQTKKWYRIAQEIAERRIKRRGEPNAP